MYEPSAKKLLYDSELPVKCGTHRPRDLFRLPILVGVCLVISVMSLACSSSPSQDLEAGRGVFVANCAVCHGAGGEGQPDWHIRKDDGTLPAPPLNGEGHTWHHADGLLYRIVSQGGAIFEDPSVPGFKSAMPSFGETLTGMRLSRCSRTSRACGGTRSNGGFRSGNPRRWPAGMIRSLETRQKARSMRHKKGYGALIRRRTLSYSETSGTEFSRLRPRRPGECQPGLAVGAPSWPPPSAR